MHPNNRKNNDHFNHDGHNDHSKDRETHIRSPAVLVDSYDRCTTNRYMTRGWRRAVAVRHSLGL